MAKKDENFEGMVTRLEALVERLEGEDLPLEEAIELYQQGVKLAEKGHARLADAERRIEEVTRAGKIVPMDPAEVDDA